MAVLPEVWLTEQERIREGTEESTKAHTSGACRRSCHEEVSLRNSAKTCPTGLQHSCSRDQGGACQKIGQDRSASRAVQRIIVVRQESLAGVLGFI